MFCDRVWQILEITGLSNTFEKAVLSLHPHAPCVYKWASSARKEEEN